MSNFVENYLFLNQKSFEVSEKQLVFLANKNKIIPNGEVKFPQIFDVEKIRRVVFEPQAFIIYMNDGIEIHLCDIPKGMSL